MFKNRCSISAIALAVSMGPAAASTFNIELNFIGAQTGYTSVDGTVINTSDYTASQKASFEYAASVWESIVTGYQGAIEIASLVLDIELADVDGAYNILAFAGPLATSIQEGFTLPTSGYMRFDSGDWLGGPLNGLAQATFEGSILHEMAHAMGFGTLWTSNGAYVDDTLQYTGANALATYQSEFAPGASFVPVDIFNGHWDECWNPTTAPAGCDRNAFNDDELMTPSATDVIKISGTTIASFRDLGYTTVDPVAQNDIVFPSDTGPSPVPLPAGGLLLLTALGMFGTMAARRRMSY